MKSNKHMTTTSSKSCNSKMRLQSSRDKVPPHLLLTLRAVQPTMLLARATLRAKPTKVRNSSSKNSRFEVITTSPIAVMYSKTRDRTAKPASQARSREVATTQRCLILEAIPSFFEQIREFGSVFFNIFGFSVLGGVFSGSFLL